MSNQVFAVLSKGGRERECEFSTQERADAFVWAKEPYMAVIQAEDISAADWQELADSEAECDQEMAEWGEFSDLEKHRIFISRLAA